MHSEAALSSTCATRDSRPSSGCMGSSLRAIVTRPPSFFSSVNSTLWTTSLMSMGPEVSVGRRLVRLRTADATRSPSASASSAMRTASSCSSVGMSSRKRSHSCSKLASSEASGLLMP